MLRLCVLFVCTLATVAVTVDERYFSPYVDATLYPITLIDDISAKTGVKLFTLGFIVGSRSDPCLPSWGGFYSIEEGPSSWNSTLGRTDYLYDHIRALRRNGGDVIVSFGGAAGSPLLECNTQGEIYQALKQVYTYTNATYFDFDIEGASQKNVNVFLLALAVWELQGEMQNLRVSLTLPVLPSGLTREGLGVYHIFYNSSIVIDSVNIMGMDFGNSVAPVGTPMSTYIIQSMVSTYDQIGNATSVGVTPMIGLNDVTSESTTLKDAAMVVTYAKANKYRSMGMWSANRDHPCNDAYVDTKCSSVCNKSGPCQAHDYDYMQIFRDFTG